jgi:hypothetical protein
MSVTNEYAPGALVQVAAVFRNPASGALMDPAAVLFKFKDPAGVVTTYTYGTDSQLVKDSTGKYHVDINASSVGRWYYKFYSTGSGQAAFENHFSVKSTNF